MGGSAGSTDPGAPIACTGTCQCRPGVECDFACGVGCQKIECLGASCTADCSAGDCELDCDEQGTCDYACSGGGCSFDCDNGSTCNVDCAAGGCEVVCDQGSTCAVKCGADGPPCTASCEGGGQVTSCEGNCVVEGC